MRRGLSSSALVLTIRAQPIDPLPSLCPVPHSHRLVFLPSSLLSPIAHRIRHLECVDMKSHGPRLRSRHRSALAIENPAQYWLLAPALQLAYVRLGFRRRLIHCITHSVLAW